MARKAVEKFAKSKGMAEVTPDVVHNAKQILMGRTDQSPSKLNKGLGRRQSMHLTDEYRFLANVSGDPLHDAFDRKLAVHAMSRNTVIAAKALSGVWDDMMTTLPTSRLRRTLYIHIPFCQSRCLYCGFYQNAYSGETAREYVDVLLKEMAGTASYPFVRNAPFQAVYFGGGTPTALPAADIHRLVSETRRLFPLTNDCEITLEGRFFHFDADKIDAAVKAGVNRFSLGVQTFNTRIRQSLGRHASRSDLIRILAMLRDLGNAAVVIDLIYGLPGQTMDIWENDINTYFELNIDGCDLYQLNIFSGGPLDAAVENGRLPRPVSIREQADYYQRGVEMMRAAHQRRLSLSHWARSTRERSMYNALSRGRSECIPLGSGAGGWIGGNMFFTESDLAAYISSVEAGKKPLGTGFAGNRDSAICRDIAAQMELGYCDLKSLGNRYHRDLHAMVGPVVNQWQEAGLVRIDNGCLHLSIAGEFWAINLAQILIDILQMHQSPVPGETR
jgi:oxygen-independent coproporphyrinogen-3 oxidase